MSTGTDVKAPFAKEGGHFYLPTGEPFYTVANKSRPGESRPAKTTDAIKVGAEPSVSTVLKVAAAPQLTNWLIQQAMDACLTLPRLEGESLDDFKVRALRDSQEQSRKARDKGTDIHGAIERSVQGLLYAPAYTQHVVNTAEALGGIGIDLYSGKPERSFCVPGGWGGKIDWSSEDALLDFKGIEDAKLDGKLGYPEHVRQLAAYSAGLDHGRAGSGRRLINIFIGRETGRVKLKEWTAEEADQAFQEFQCLLKFYRLTKGFPVTGMNRASA